MGLQLRMRQAVIDVKALQYTTPTALTRATKPFSIKRVSRNSRAALCQRSLPFSVCRCPLRKYHGLSGSYVFTFSGGLRRRCPEVLLAPIYGKPCWVRYARFLLRRGTGFTVNALVPKRGYH